MTVTVDKQGRIVIPKTLRDHLGLHAGTKLNLDVTEDQTLTVHPVRDEPALQSRDGVLVHVGTWTGGDVDDTLRRIRDERAQKLMGL